MSNMPFKLGEWIVLCDRCHFKRYSSQVIENWKGLIVCKPEVKQGCWEPRHEQDFIRDVKEDQAIPFARPRPTDTFTTVAVVGPEVGVQDTRIPTNSSGQFGL